MTLLDPAPLTVLTGAGGWFGRAWLRASAEPRPRHGPLEVARVRALAATPEEVPAILAVRPDAQVHVGDVADSEVVARLLAGADGADVVHAAAVIHPARVADFARVNVGGTETMLAAAARAGVRRFVHLSSNSAFGVNPTRAERFHQEEPFRPWLGYGESKARAEQLVRDADGARLETAVIRPPWFYGPWQPARQTTFFTMVAAGRFPLMGDGRQVRSMVDVDNLVQGAALASRVAGVGGQAFWVADATPYEMREVVATVGRVLAEEGYRVSARTLRVPEVVARVAERVDRTLQARGIYHQEVHVLGEMDKTIACDITATREVLGYDPQLALAEGMREAVRWCREQGIDIAPRAGGAR